MSPLRPLVKWVSSVNAVFYGGSKASNGTS